MSEKDIPSKKEQDAIEAAKRGLRRVGEDAAEYIPTPGSDKVLKDLLNDLVKDPYGGKRPYEPPRITKHEELGQTSFSVQED